MKTRPQQLFPITIPMTFHRTHGKILRALKTPTTYVSRSKAWITMFNCVTEWYEYASVLFLGECGWRSEIAQERVTFVLIPKYFSRLCIYGRCLLHSFTCFPFADEDTVIDDAVYQSLGWFHLDWIWLLSPPPPNPAPRPADSPLNLETTGSLLVLWLVYENEIFPWGLWRRIELFLGVP